MLSMIVALLLGIILGIGFCAVLYFLLFLD